MIEKHLAKLQAAKPKPGDKVPFEQTGGIALGKLTLGDDARVNEDHHYSDNGVFKRVGNATLGLANDFRGMPQLGMELRGYGLTAYDLGNVSGEVTLDVMDGQSYIMNPTGPVTIVFEIADFESPYDRAGIDIDFTVAIENAGGHAITMTVDKWGPTGSAPVLDSVGYYEFSIGIMKFPTRQIVRAWPVSQPEVSA